MRQWALLERVVGEVYVDTGESCEADTFGRAAETLLPAELWRCGFDALQLDVLLGDNPPTWFRFTADGGTYKVVPVATDLDLARTFDWLDADHTAALRRLRDSGIVP